MMQIYIKFFFIIRVIFLLKTNYKFHNKPETLDFLRNHTSVIYTF